MAVTSDDRGIRFIHLTLGEVGVSRDQLSIDGFIETANAEDDARHFMRSWSDFDRTGVKNQLYEKKSRKN